MLLLDFNAICIAGIMTQRNIPEFDENYIKHIILNSIRMHAAKHKEKYGYPVICCDARSWRKDYFKEYKWKRRSDNTPEEKEEWDLIFKTIDQVKQDLMENFPYKVIHVNGAEADDIIGVLTELSNEFGHYEDVMIISGDKDFVQLQKYKNVKQYSPIKKKFIVEKNPRKYLVEHILKGDSGDGIPNVLSADDTFVVEGKRQRPVTKKFIDAILDADLPEESTVWNEEVARNYARNKKLIDLTETPEDIRSEIINKFETQKVAHKSKVMNYLITNRMKMLVESVSDFI